MHTSPARNHGVCLALGLLAAALAGSACGRTAESGVRVVLITLDTLRYDQLDPDGQDAPAMPLTLARARRGRVFQRFYAAAPLTQPAHATMFTGHQPWEHGVTRNGVPLPDRWRSVAECLKEAGFETRAVVASFPLAGRFGFERGFDEFTEEFSLPFHNHMTRWEREWEVPGGEFYSLGEAVTDRAIEALDRSNGSRQFLWFHYFDAHSPYGSTRGETFQKLDILDPARRGGASVPDLLERARELYALDVAYLDAALDRLFRRLERDADLYETHILVVSDHGESLGESGSVGHGTRLTEEQIHVPAFLLSPKVEPGRCPQVAASIDVARTLLSLADLPVRSGSFGGRDLTQPLPPDARAFAMRKTYPNGRGRELRLDGRFHRWQGRLFCEVDAGGRIYRGNGDALETGAAAPTDPARAERRAMFQVFERMLDSVTSDSPLDPEVERALRALGYGG